MKVINNIIGKTIKYCNIVDGIDGYERNILATTDNEILMYNIDYENGTIKIYNEEKVNKAITVHRDVRFELLSNKIITQEEIDIIVKTSKDLVAKREKQLKKQRYEEYLKLKEEFEPAANKEDSPREQQQ